MAREIPETIGSLLEHAEAISATEVASAAGVSRQAAHAHLRRLVERGELTREGRARATRYRRASHRRAPPGPTETHLGYARQGRREGCVWQDVRPFLPALEPNAEETLAYAVTEIVNNAIDQLDHVFAEYKLGLDPARSRTVIQLFAIDVRFVTRSEAKRLLHGLEKFREVVLDFNGVRGVGQGFADEVFRVWARAHPETKLTPVNMGKAVAFMVGRVGS